MPNILVAYFSATGNTAKLAKNIASQIGADLFEIKPQQPYSSQDLNWQDKNSRSSLETKDTKSRPAISNEITNLSQYNTIFVGFPIWWYEQPRIIQTFLESYDFSGKTLIPFATSGSSGFGDTDQNLHAACSPSTQWKPGKRFAGSGKTEIDNWIKTLGL